jgi:hypothetical protein
MPPDPNDANPYRSPLEPSGPDASAPTIVFATSGAFRWRLIPATLLGFWGAMIIVGVLISSGKQISACLNNDDNSLWPWEQFFPLNAMIGAQGIAVILGAGSIWKRRWLRAVITLAIAAVLFLAAIILPIRILMSSQHSV